MEKYPERRSESRLYLWTPINIEEWGISFIYRARLANYSRSGIYFEADLLLHPGANVYIGIQDSNHDFFSEDQGFFLVKVIWRKPLIEMGFNYGYGTEIIVDEAQKKSQINDGYRAKEYRKNPRKPYLKPTYFTFKNKYYKGAIKNISHKGAFIESKVKFLSGDKLKLVVPGAKKYFLLRGEIVHFNPAGFGVEFKRLLKTKRFPKIKDQVSI